MVASRKASRGGHYMDEMAKPDWYKEPPPKPKVETPVDRMEKLWKLITDNRIKFKRLKKAKKSYWFRKRTKEEQEENDRLDKEMDILDIELKDYLKEYDEALKEHKLYNSAKSKDLRYPYALPHETGGGGSRKKSRKSKGLKKRSTRRK